MGKTSTIVTTLPDSIPKPAGVAKLILCAVGICSCYLCYGFLQERFFQENIVSATFLLVTQCISNTIVAIAWQQMEGAYDSTSQKIGKLHHPLLLLSK